jgi:hypothetical protein
MARWQGLSHANRLTGWIRGENQKDFAQTSLQRDDEIITLLGRDA